MKIQYLGTAAAEAIPSLFCECSCCRRSRELKGKNIRGRSGVVIDDTLMIDFPPDVYFKSIQLGIHLSKIERMLITHTHLDHFAVNELMMRDSGCFAHLPKGKETLHLYGNQDVGRVLGEAMHRQFGDEKRDFVSYQEVKPFQPFIAGTARVTPLPARHMTQEHSLMYIVEAGGKSLLYAHDSGLFFDETWEYIKNRHFDAVSLDCCFGTLKGCGGHMGMPENLSVKTKLFEYDCADQSTRFILSHFSHNCGSVHVELEQAADPLGFIVAYDGMVIDL